jgi:hypothetical protein
MDTRYKRWIDLVFAALAVLALSVPAAAQISSEVQSALRANCRSDAMSKCSGMRGQEALACLQKNVSSLSPACKAAVSKTLPKPHSEAPAPLPAAAAPAPAQAAAPPPAPAQATIAPAPPAAPTVAAPPPPAHPKATASQPPAKPAAKPVAIAKPAPAAPKLTAAQQNAMKSACRSDFMSHCRGVPPGGKAALACLQKNVAALSPGCKRAVSGTMAAPAAAIATAPPAAAAPAEAGGPSPEQMSALKFTCRRDFGRLCKGVAAGGPEALNCLQQNAARLSPNCRTSLTDIANALPAGAMPAAPAAPVVRSPETGGPVDAVVMVRACKLDLIRYCRDAKLGEHRKIECLTAHMPRLTVRCRTALKVTSPLR